MISLMPKEEERIYIDELAKIVNRKVGTIRKWESDGWLPRHLLPKRGKRTMRYWTHQQVYGKRGLIAWMERNDMRPGNMLTDPSVEDEHVEHLRRPKFLDGNKIRGVHMMIDNGRSREYIVESLFPRTRYSRPENLESALVRYFAEQGWYFPPAKRKRKTKLSKTKLAEIDRLERRIERLGG
jgi:hypothetical protein